ncbi:MAG: hypothetical protein Q8942_14505 [Bacillota bacterium]|nr:hypothetical protein [Bacillota bacterium]
MKSKAISDPVFISACKRIEELYGGIPFKERGITVSSELIKATIEILNDETNKTLPQNCRNQTIEKTPYGLDYKIKERLNTNLRTANIISDILHKAGIVTVIDVINPATGRNVKGTKLLQEWCW